VPEFVPVPLGRLLRRARLEFERQRAIFDLPERKFSRPSDSAGTPASERLDLSVLCSGARAAHPIGLAAGPHTQLAQNIALGWLAGARVIELKTVQANDRITVSRPCIDIATVGYNTEWSQELRLDESLREYVTGAMLIEALDEMGVTPGDSGFGIRDSGLGTRDSDGSPSRRRGRGTSHVVFDVSVGYDLEGIRSRAVVSWLESMQDARAIVDELRAEIPGEMGSLRDFPFRTSIAAGVTLSTFHGTPADEIERIGEFLIGELGFHTIIKVNPSMLGRERVEAILHGSLGYDEVEVDPAAYERGLTFEDAADVVRRLRSLAARRGVTAGVKCGNTLEVVNTGAFLKARVQYLSGQPLHALHAALAWQWRETFGPDLPISFSAGVDAGNAADCVAAGLAPVTVCTDLLRAGGYGRLPRYVANLEARMRAAGARTIPEFIERTAAGSADAGDGGALLHNARALAERARSDERYRAARNRKRPRKLGTRLWLWDCLSCNKCISVCPNDAIFEIEVDPFVGEVPVVEVDGAGWRETGRRLYRAVKPTQIAIVADACNDCGNCDVFCPEDGGPHLEKPMFFGSVESWRRAAPRQGFVLSREHGAFVMRGRLATGECALSYLPGADRAVFESGGARVTVGWQAHEVLAAELLIPLRPLAAPKPALRLPSVSGRSGQAGGPFGEGGSPEPRVPNPEPRVPNPESRVPKPESRIPVVVDLSASMTLRLLLGSLLRPPRVNFVNADFVE